MIKIFEDDFPVFDLKDMVKFSSFNKFPMFREVNGEYILKINVPGFNSNNIKVCHSESKLIISGEVSEQSEYVANVNSIRHEVPLTGSLDLKTLKATAKDGVLTVTVQKLGVVKVSKEEFIPIKVTKE